MSRLSPLPTQLSRRIAGRFSEQAGLTLIEVLVTALLVVLITAASATALVSGARGSADEQFRSQADSLAAQDIDQLRALPDEQLSQIQNGQLRTHSITLGAVAYTVTSTVSYMTPSGSTGCSASANALYQLTSTVSWTTNGYKRSISENSEVSRPVAGDVVSPVTDPSGNPLGGVNLTVTGPTYQATQTASGSTGGCGIFDGLTPGGSYTFTASKPGYVDINGNAQSTQSLTVPSAGTTVSYQLGQSSGPINATFKTATTGTGTTGEADGLSWMISSGTGAGMVPSSGASTSSTETSNSGLYPSTYQVWAGRCAGQEPPSPNTTTVSVLAGQSATATVLEPALYVQVTGQGNAIKPNDIWLTYRNNGCVDSWPVTVAPASTVPSTGWLANPGQPYAFGTSTSNTTLSICADFYYATNKTWYQQTVPVGTGNDTFNSPASSTSANTVTVNLTGNTTGQCTQQTS